MWCSIERACSKLLADIISVELDNYCSCIGRRFWKLSLTLFQHLNLTKKEKSFHFCEHNIKQMTFMTVGKTVSHKNKKLCANFKNDAEIVLKKWRKNYIEKFKKLTNT